MYIEFLARSFSSPRSVRNYLSGVRLLHNYLGRESPSLDNFNVDLMLRAVDITLPHVPNRRLPITEPMLIELCSLCDSQGVLGLVLKCAILLAFFGFLRQSNLAPKSTRDFDPTRHTCRADVLEHPPGLVIIMKWSKTLQLRASKPHLIPIPSISGHPLCPVRAYRAMIAAVPTTCAGDPLLLLPGNGRGPRPLLLPNLRQSFQVLLTALGHDPTTYSLHSLWRGGATSAFRAGFDCVHVQRHGARKSDVFWQYIVSDAPHKSPVAAGLARSAFIRPEHWPGSVDD